MSPRLPTAALVLLCFAAPAANAHETPIAAAAFPGVIELKVDATDISRRIFSVRQEIPVDAGLLRLHYPQWLPGGHGPYGPVEQLGGLRFEAGGKSLPWRRDPLDMYSFLVEVPAGATQLGVDFQFLSPLASSQGRVVVTPEIIGLQWNTVALYPAGQAARGVTVRPSLLLPAGWQFGTALEVESREGALTRFKPVDLDTLVDSPLLAGKYFKRFELHPGAKVAVDLAVVADRLEELEANPEILADHRKLVQQAYKLYGPGHFRNYNFLLSISERYAGIGLEHQASSENGVGAGYLTDRKKTRDRDLLAHELTHSWNGKYRRGADNLTPHFNTPMQDSLLWVYEGQTQYWGNVLAARSGMRSAEDARDSLALIAASLEHREGRAWRSLLDTTNQPIIMNRRPIGWRSWQRGEDYYSEGELIWLDADTLIREKTAGRKSLDDFARAFFAEGGARIEPLPYTFADVVAALNGVVPHDWDGFLRQRVEGVGEDAAPTGGLARAGWKLVYTDKPNAVAAAGGAARGGTDLTYSLGLTVGADLQLGDVLWDSPAFKAGLASSMKLVAVNGIAASGDALKDAVVAAAKTGAPIDLLVNNLDHIVPVRIDYRGGLRYPHLERIKGAPDRLADIHAARE